MSGEKVLIVDDTGFSRIVIEKTLASLDLEYTHAKSGQEALDHLGRVKFDLVISDYLMPEMDGLELYRRALAAAFNNSAVCTPFILITAHSSKDLAETAGQLGIAAVVQKSSQGMDLVERVQEVLGGAGVIHLNLEVTGELSVKLQALSKRFGTSGDRITRTVLETFLRLPETDDLQSIEQIVDRMRLRSASWSG